jgi:ring-1,2-phenylacetyl-CoA epoxidase subunit PaaD
VVTAEAIWGALREVKDPEIPPVSVVDMGMVSQVTVNGEQVAIDMTPTFVGCPALEIIRRDITNQVATVPGVSEVVVRFVFDPPWTSERITALGRERLKQFGIAPPLHETSSSLINLDLVPDCPFCGSPDTHMENLFGPTACRSIFYCDGCRQPFEGIKTV